LKSDRSLLKSIGDFFARLDTMLMVNFLIGIGFLFAVVSAFTFDSKSLFSGILITLFLFFVGLAGLPIMMRQEFNFTYISVEGFIAVALGAFISFTGFISSTIFIIGFLNTF
jgi:hypothetical protein